MSGPRASRRSSSGTLVVARARRSLYPVLARGEAWLGATWQNRVVRCSSLLAWSRSCFWRGTFGEDARTPRLRIGTVAPLARRPARLPRVAARSARRAARRRRSRCSSSPWRARSACSATRHREREGHRHRRRARPLGLDARGARCDPRGVGEQPPQPAASASRGSTPRRRSSATSSRGARPIASASSSSASARTCSRRRRSTITCSTSSSSKMKLDLIDGNAHGHRRRGRHRRGAPPAERRAIEGDHPAHRRRLERRLDRARVRGAPRQRRWAPRSTPSRSATATRSTCRTGIDLFGQPHYVRAALPGEPGAAQEASRPTPAASRTSRPTSKALAASMHDVLDKLEKTRFEARSATIEDLFPFLLLPGVALVALEALAPRLASSGGSREASRDPIWLFGHRCSRSWWRALLVLGGDRALRRASRSASAIPSAMRELFDRAIRRGGALEGRAARHRRCARVRRARAAAVRQGHASSSPRPTSMSSIVLDYSKSMYARDVAPSRIARAKAEVARLIRDLPGARFGAVAFAGEPMGFPLTERRRRDRAVLPPARAERHAGRRHGHRARPRARARAARPRSEVEGAQARHRAGHRRRGSRGRSGGRRRRAPRKRGRRSTSCRSAVARPSASPRSAPTARSSGWRKDERASRSPPRSRPRARRSSPRSPGAGGQAGARRTRETGIDTIAQDLKRKMTEELAERVETVYADVYMYPLGVALVLLIAEVFLSESGRKRAGGGKGGDGTAGSEIRRGSGIARCRCHDVAGVRRHGLRMEPVASVRARGARGQIGRGAARRGRSGERFGAARGVPGDRVLRGRRARDSTTRSGSDLSRASTSGSRFFSWASASVNASVPKTRAGGSKDDPAAQQLAELRNTDVECGLRIILAVASEPDVPLDLRARAHYLAGNLEFLRKGYAEAVRHYDETLKITPGLVADAQRWNRPRRCVEPRHRAGAYRRREEEGCRERRESTARQRASRCLERAELVTRRGT